MNKCIWLIGNIHSNEDRKERYERFESLKKLGYKIISKHYFENVPLIDVIYELMNMTLNDQRVMILHYQDSILNIDQVTTYMNIRQTVISKPVFFDKTGILEKLDDEYCLSGLITDVSKLREYFNVHKPQNKTMRYLRWIDMMEYFNKKASVKDIYISYNLCRRDEEIEVELVERVTEAQEVEQERALKQINSYDAVINNAIEKIKTLTPPVRADSVRLNNMISNFQLFDA